MTSSLLWDILTPLPLVNMSFSATPPPFVRVNGGWGEGPPPQVRISFMNIPTRNFFLDNDGGGYYYNDYVCFTFFFNQSVTANCSFVIGT